MADIDRRMEGRRPVSVQVTNSRDVWDLTGRQNGSLDRDYGDVTYREQQVTLAQWFMMDRVSGVMTNAGMGVVKLAEPDVKAFDDQTGHEISALMTPRGPKDGEERTIGVYFGSRPLEGEQRDGGIVTEAVFDHFMQTAARAARVSELADAWGDTPADVMYDQLARRGGDAVEAEIASYRKLARAEELLKKGGDYYLGGEIRTLLGLDSDRRSVPNETVREVLEERLQANVLRGVILAATAQARELHGLANVA